VVRKEDTGEDDASERTRIGSTVLVAKKGNIWAEHLAESWAGLGKRRIWRWESHIFVCSSPLISSLREFTCAPC
jgi:hypothetical protein